MYTIVLSGPERTRAKAELCLEEARVPVYPDRHHAVMDWPAMFPSDNDRFLAVEHEDVDHVVDVVAQASGWRLRMHYPTPQEPKPSQAQALAATVAQMQAEIDALTARVGR